jgi:CTP synthase (UTP-ammonia lyase)
VLGLTGAAHAEEDPEAEMRLLTPVACPLPNRADGAPKLSGHDRVLVHEGTQLRAILGVDSIDQEYFCNYEPNPEYRDLFERGGFRVCAETVRGEVRAAERPEHPFFIGVLFQPQRSSRPGEPHRLIEAFVRAAGGLPPR